ncbi:MAG: D-tyrosyl-tRNA(Tyr) deacylase [Gammaproteobacteria bacterium]|nr:MAG: D-tyrosyl-tRNA(Tyr) deacylase [Gammaproteobacteria bacterium]
MKALLQRVSQAAVVVEGETVGAIGAGLLILLGIEQGDTVEHCQRLADRCLRYRIFPDEQGRMNRSLLDCGGQLLLVSQFTLAADTHSGLRPSFTPAAAPEWAKTLYEQFAGYARGQGVIVQTGHFGAHMQVSLVNDGPVTFLLDG